MVSALFYTLSLCLYTCGFQEIKNCGIVYDLFVCAVGRIILIFYCLEGQDVK